MPRRSRNFVTARANKIYRVQSRASSQHGQDYSVRVGPSVAARFEPGSVVAWSIHSLHRLLGCRDGRVEVVPGIEFVYIYRHALRQPKALNQSPPMPTRSLVPGSVRKGRDAARQGRISQRAPRARSRVAPAHPPGRPVPDCERSATAPRPLRHARVLPRAAPAAANRGQGLCWKRL